MKVKLLGYIKVVHELKALLSMFDVISKAVNFVIDSMKLQVWWRQGMLFRENM